MALKGVKALTREVNIFLKPFGVKCTIDTEFAYYYNKDLITYTLVFPVAEEEEFQRSIARLEPELNMDSFLWSLLHELGHHETLDEINDEEYQYCQDMKKLISDMDNDIPSCFYYDLTDERKATEWAVHYANTHQKQLEEFWHKVQPKILRIYSLNNVDISEE